MRDKSNIEFIPKGSKGIIKLARSLKNGRKVVMLVDQRLSNGIDVKFLNQDSKTTDAVATFALKHNYKVYSAVVFRRSFSSFFDLKVEEFEVVKLGKRMYTPIIHKRLDPRGKPYYWIGGEPYDFDEPGSDGYELCKYKKTTVTPLKIDLTNNMNSLKKWFE